MPAPKGNKNSFKHGFYTSYVSPEYFEGQQYKRVKNKGLENERNALRAKTAQMLDSVKGKDHSDKEIQPTISNIIQAFATISLLEIRIKILSGREPETQQAILEAVKEIDVEMQKKYGKSDETPMQEDHENA